MDDQLTAPRPGVRARLGVEDVLGKGISESIRTRGREREREKEGNHHSGQGYDGDDDIDEEEEEQEQEQEEEGAARAGGGGGRGEEGGGGGCCGELPRLLLPSSPDVVLLRMRMALAVEVLHRNFCEPPYRHLAIG